LYVLLQLPAGTDAAAVVRRAWYSATATSRIIKWTMRWPGLRQRSVR
jgi:hypothetical protein